MAEDLEAKKKYLEVTKALRILERQELTDSKEYSKLLEKQKKLLKNIEESTEKSLRKNKQLIGDATKGLRDMAGAISEGFGVFIGFDLGRRMSELFVETSKLNKELHRTLINSGKFGASLAEAKDITMDLRTGFGASAKEAATVVGTLSSKQYIGNLREAANSSYEFARATGMGTQEVAELTTKLQKEGQVGTRATTAIYSDLLKIQQANGLTKEGMTAVTNQIVKNTALLRAFGKSETDIRRMAAQTGQLVSAFEKVGIAATETTALIDKMLNPENIEKNIPLYAALGVSITDAISGNIDENVMASGLKDFGQKLKEMGPIAGKAYADAMGVSYSMAIKAVDAELPAEPEMTPEEKAQETLKQLTENTKAFEEKVSDMVNKIDGVFQKAPQALKLAIIGLFPIVAGLLKRAADDFTEDLAKKMRKTFITSADDFEDIFSKKKLDIGDVLRMNMSDINKYLSSVDLEERDRINGMLDDVFNRMATDSKGIRWFDQQQKELEEMIGSLEKINKEHDAERATLRNALKENIHERDVLLAKKKNGLALTEKEKARLATLNVEIGNARQELERKSKAQKSVNDAIIQERNALERVKNQQEAVLENMRQQERSARRIRDEITSTRYDTGSPDVPKRRTIRDVIKGGASKAGGAIRAGASKISGGIGKLGGLGGIMKALGPIAIIATVIGVIAKFIGNILKENEEFQKFVEQMKKVIFDPIKKAIDQAFKSINLKELGKAIATIASVVGGVLARVLPIIVGAINFIVKIINAIASWFGKEQDDITTNVKSTAENTAKDKPAEIYVDSNATTRIKDVSGATETITSTNPAKTSADTTVSSKEASGSKSSSESSESSSSKREELRSAGTSDAVNEITKLLTDVDGGLAEVIANSIRIAMANVTININNESGTGTVSVPNTMLMGSGGGA